MLRALIAAILDQDSVAGSVIGPSGMVLFEDVLRTVTASAAICAACSVRTNLGKATLNWEATQGATLNWEA